MKRRIREPDGEGVQRIEGDRVFDGHVELVRELSLSEDFQESVAAPGLDEAM